MDDPHIRQRHPNAPPYPSSAPYPDPPSASSRLYPDLSHAPSGDGRAPFAPPPPGFHDFNSGSAPYPGDQVPPYPPQPPPPQQQQRQHHQHAYRAQRPRNVCDAVREKLVLVLIGVLLFCGGVGVTFWNEGRTVKRSKALEEGLTMVTTLQSSPRDGRIPVSFELADSLIHVTERLSVPKAVTDPHFNVVVHATKIKRVVEMLQWVETEHRRDVTNDNGETVTEYAYDYTQEWRSTLVNSVGFNSPGHSNPATFPLQGQTFEAEKVYVGPFSLSPDLVAKIEWFTSFDISRLHAHLLPMGSKRYENWIFFGATPSRPAIGDWRVSFDVAGNGDPVNAETVSVVGKQIHSRNGEASIGAFTTTNGDLIDFVYQGGKTKEQIFSSERKSNLFFSWMMRGAGWLLMFIGVLSISDLVTSIFTGIPLLRDLVAMTSLTFALVVSGTASLFVIALGWCVYRPLFALICVGIALVPILVVRSRRVG